MLFDTDTLFTIGQFAKLHEINKKTLMWYDQTGILKPAVIKENGYRYYSYQQSGLLETILMLRELNVSLKEIQSFLKDRSAEALEQLLCEKVEEVDRNIRRLKEIRKVLNEKRKDMAAIRNLDISSFSIVEKPQERYLVTVSTSAETAVEKEIRMIIEETKKHHLHRLHDASYGSMIPVEKLYSGDFSDYYALYIDLPFAPRRHGVHMQPKGTYLRAFCKGDWSRIPQRYEEILDYAGRRGLVLSGFAYEKGINELVIDSEEDYITQIEIPIKAE